MRQSKPIPEVICPSCGRKMILRETSKFKTKDGKPNKFYGCSGYPDCREIHGAHPSGHPLGIPATKEVRGLRRQVHDLMDQIFGKWDDLDRTEKAKIYDYMRENCPKTHVGEMDKEDCLRTIEILRKEIAGLEEDSGLDSAGPEYNPDPSKAPF